MNPLQALYAFVAGGRNHAYDKGWLRVRSLCWPVVCVGNLSVGGAGKTPLTLALARLLQARGIHVDVLSRGYGRRSPRAVERVDPQGSADRFGDEPLLLARAGIPVYVGADRWAAGVLAERDGGGLPAAVHLLDDGFGHRRLHRDADVVLLHPSDRDGGLLPTGRLREPLSSIRRAHFLVLREEDDATEPALRRTGLNQPVWRVRRTVSVPPVAGPAVAFCAIAHPREFFRALPAPLARTFAFPDHHRFRPRELAAIAQAARGAAALLTTEKDLVRLPPEARAQLQASAPLHAVPLRAELLDAQACIDALLARIMRE